MKKLNKITKEFIIPGFLAAIGTQIFFSVVSYPMSYLAVNKNILEAEKEGYGESYCKYIMEYYNNKSFYGKSFLKGGADASRNYLVEKCINQK